MSTSATASPVTNAKPAGVLFADVLSSGCAAMMRATTAPESQAQTRSDARTSEPAVGNQENEAAAASQGSAATSASVVPVMPGLQGQEETSSGQPNPQSDGRPASVVSAAPAEDMPSLAAFSSATGTKPAETLLLDVLSGSSAAAMRSAAPGELQAQSDSHVRSSGRAAGKQGNEAAAVSQGNAATSIPVVTVPADCQRQDAVSIAQQNKELDEWAASAVSAAAVDERAPLAQHFEKQANTQAQQASSDASRTADAQAPQAETATEQASNSAGLQAVYVDPAAPLLATTQELTQASGAESVASKAIAESFKGNFAVNLQAGSAIGKASSSPASTNPGIPATPIAGKSQNADVTASSPRSGQDSRQPAQHAQADASQTIVATAKPAESNARQAGDFALHAAAPQTTAAHSAPARIVEARSEAHQAAGLPVGGGDSGEQVNTPGINTAHLIKTMSESEMRVGMYSNEFGDISIRTSVSPQQLMTQISVEHGGLGTAIAAHVAQVQEKLGNEFGLHASIEVNQGGASLTGEHQQSSQQQHRASARSVLSAAAGAESEDVGPLALPSLGGGWRLDIRA